MNRSPREADLIKRLELLDRRTLALVRDSGETKVTSSLRFENPTPALVTHGLAGDDWRAWWERNIGIIMTQKGWVRTRIFECLDYGKSGTSVESGLENQTVPKYFVLHGESVPFMRRRCSSDCVLRV